MPWDGKKLPDALAIAATAAANAAANGSKNAAYLTYLQGQIGSNYILKLVREDVVVWQATASGTLPISGSRFVLPTSVTQTSITSADIDTGEWILRVEHPTEGSTKYIAALVTPLIGAGPFYLTADLDVGGTLTLGSLVLNSPSFDVAVGGDTFQTVALTDMRKSGWTGSYADSYALNDGNLWGRGTSSQRYKASLTMSRYPMKTTANTGPNGLQLIDAFVAARNRDYVLELEDGVLGGWIGPQTQTGVVARLLLWNQIFLDETLQFAHAPGYTGNSRVMMWGAEIWLKISGTWTLISANPSNAFSGESWSPRFNLFGGVGISSTGTISTEDNIAIYANNIDARIESSTGYMSARPAPYVAGTGQKTTPQDAPYWQFHGFCGGLLSINPSTVQDVLILHKCALVLHNPAGTDDRDYARFLLGCGADWYPAPGVTVDGNPNFVPGIGTSRHKYVRAKYPDWQWAIMHTMDATEFNATNGFPPSLTNLVEGIDPAVAPTVSDSRRFAWVDPDIAWASQPTLVGVGAATYPYMQVNSVWTNPRPITEFPEPGVLAEARPGQTIPAGEYTIARVTHPTNASKMAILHRIDDRYLTYSGSTERSQFLTYAIRDNTHYWVAFSYRMGADAAGDSINCFDVHTSGDDIFGRQPVELFWTGDGFRLEHFGQYDTNVTDPDGEIRTVSWESGSLGTQTWQHIVLRVRVAKSWAGNPSIQAWHATGNGVLTQVVDRSDIEMGFYNMADNQCFPKLGLYRWDLTVRASAHTTGLYVFRDGAGTPTIDAAAMHALLMSKQ